MRDGKQEALDVTLDEAVDAAMALHRADARLVNAVVAALAAGNSAAKIAREAELPYARVLRLRHYA